MKAFEAAATVETDQAIHVAGVPFAAGTEVDVVIIPRRQAAADFETRWNEVCRLLRADAEVTALDDSGIQREIHEYRAGR